jgi:DNA adenine methylase
MVEPILKWAGGKRQILSEIHGTFPPESVSDTYHEPFFGGGALFFKTGPYNYGTINDINKRLMNFYRVVRENPPELIEALESFKPPESPPDPDYEFSELNRKGKPVDNYYYQQRELFNRRPNGERVDKIEEAALLLYLNRTCYNGLYRENQSGEFNVPIGSNSNPDWVRSSRIHKASQALVNVEIFGEDFSYVKNYVQENDLVYFDPPYRPLPKSSSFVEYSSEAFGTDEQKRLRDLAKKLNELGAYVVISNSPPVRELYENHAGFHIESVGANRVINSNADDRGEVMEVIITNINPEQRRERTGYLDQFVQEPST